MSLLDDPTEIGDLPTMDAAEAAPDELDDRFEEDPTSSAWSIHMSLALGVGLLVSWSSLMGALDGSVSLRNALVQLAATSTAALLGITFVAALYRFLVERQDGSAEVMAVAVATGGSDESDV